MAEQKNFVEFNQGLGDTGQDNISSVQPITDGEGASQTVFRRPTENIRARTELLRSDVSDLQYYRDYGHLLIEYTGGTITWNGLSGTPSPAGKIAVTGGTFTISPMLSPSASKKGVITSGTVSVNQITYTMKSTTFATHGANAMYISHIDGGVGTTLSASVTDGPVRRFVVLFDSANATHTPTAVAAALNGLSTFSTYIQTSTSGTGIIDDLAETRFEGTQDSEKHVITATDIQALTVATPLTAGKGIGIWYRYLIEPTGNTVNDPKGVGTTGGRAESSADRLPTSHAIPSASLFVTDSDPSKIPGAIPFCKVGFNGQLIFYDGTRLEEGESFQFKSYTSIVTTLATTAGAGMVGYNGSGLWASGLGGDQISAATVEGAIDEVVSDLAAVTSATDSGANRVGVYATNYAGALTAIGGGGAATTDTTVRLALQSLNDQVVKRRAYTSVVTDGTNSTGGDINSTTPMTSINTLGSGHYYFRRGSYSLATALTSGIDFVWEGERGDGATVLTNGLAANFDINAGGNAGDLARIENMSLRNPNNTTYRFVCKGRRAEFRNCTAQAGGLAFDAVSAQENRIAIQNLSISDDLDASQNHAAILFTHSTAATNDAIVGTVDQLRISKVTSYNSGSNEKYALHIKDLVTSASATKEHESLVFSNALLFCGGSSGFGSGGGSVLRVENSDQSLTFNNCTVRNDSGVANIKSLHVSDCSRVVFNDCDFSSGSSTGGVLLMASVTGAVFRNCRFTGNSSIVVASITDCEDVLFDNCTFTQDGTGATLNAFDNYNTVFRDCVFTTSSSTAASNQIHAYGGSTAYKHTKFVNCRMVLRNGSTSVPRQIELGSISNTAQGAATVLIEGLEVRATHTNGWGDKNFTYISGTDDRALRVTLKDIKFNFNGNTLTNATGQSALVFSGYTGPLVDIQGLYLYDWSPAVTNASDHILVYLFRAGVSGGALNTTANPVALGSVAWKALFKLDGDDCYVNDTAFFSNTATGDPPAARLIWSRGARCQIKRNTAYALDAAGSLSSLVATMAGWFCWLDAGGESQVTDNFIFATAALTGSGAFETDGLIRVESHANLIANNTCATGPRNYVMIALASTGHRSNVTGNVITANLASTNIDGITIDASATHCLIVGNVLENTSGTGTLNITGTGASSTIANNIQGV